MSEAAFVPEQDLGPHQQVGRRGRSGIGARAGVVLLGLSIALWLPLPVVPFLSLSGATKAGLAGGLVLGAEIAFWLGALLAGPEAARRVRSWVRGALRRRRSNLK